MQKWYKYHLYPRVPYISICLFLLNFDAIKLIGLYYCHIIKKLKLGPGKQNPKLAYIYR